MYINLYKVLNIRKYFLILTVHFFMSNETYNFYKKVFIKIINLYEIYNI